MNIEPDERELVTVDWKYRQLRLKVNITGLIPLNFSIQTWVDCSKEYNGITIQAATGSITINNVYPTIVVYQVPHIEIPEKNEINLLLAVVQSPIISCR